MYRAYLLLSSTCVELFKMNFTSISEYIYSFCLRLSVVYLECKRNIIFECYLFQAFRY